MKSNPKHFIDTNLQSPYLFSKVLVYALLIALFTFIIYTPTRYSRFTNWDDEAYVVKNPDITSVKKHGDSLLTKVYLSNYHPLTMVSYALDYSMGKLDPRVYHRTNLLLHCVNALLVFWFILLLTGNAEVSLICGMLFGIHPVHVESVAWISERKNVLYALFFLLSLITYIYYIRKEKNIFYFLALFLFILSLLSKAVAVSLAVTLVAVDFALGRKLTSIKIWIEKIPFLVLSLAFGILAVRSQPIGLNDPGISRGVHVNFFERLLFASYSFGQYILKLFAPLKLAIFYPYPGKVNGLLPMPYYILPAIVLLSLIVLFIVLLRKKGLYPKFILFCLLLFILNIAMLLQLIPVGGAIMADRYAYIPSIGIFLFIALGYKYLSEKNKKIKYGLIALFVLYFAAMSQLTYVRSGIWQNSITLWTDQIKKYPDVAFSYTSRGLAEYDMGNYEEAYQDYKKSVEVDPFYYAGYFNKGIIEMKRHNYKIAINDFTKVINKTQSYYTYMNRGRAKYFLKDYKGAVQDYSEYLKHYPGDPEAYFLRGETYFYWDKDSLALEDYNNAIQLNPSYADAYTHRGILLAVWRKYESALKDFNKAALLNPSYGLNYYNRARLKFYMGQQEEGCADMLKASQCNFTEARETYQQYCGRVNKQ